MKRSSLLFALILALAAASGRAGPRVRFYPSEGTLDRNGMVLLIFDEKDGRAAGRMRRGKAHLRQVRTSEVVPMELIELGKADGLRGHLVGFRPTRELKPFTTYRFESRRTGLDLTQVYRTASTTAERLSAKPPRFRRVRGDELHFRCRQLELASWIHIEVERSAEMFADEAWDEDYATRWEPVGTYLLKPTEGERGPVVDLSPVLGEDPSGPHRLRFTLIGRDGFTGRPSRWRILPFPVAETPPG